MSDNFIDDPEWLQVQLFLAIRIPLEEREKSLGFKKLVEAYHNEWSNSGLSNQQIKERVVKMCMETGDYVPTTILQSVNESKESEELKHTKPTERKQNFLNRWFG